MTTISESIQPPINTNAATNSATNLSQGLDQALSSIASIQEQEKGLLELGRPVDQQINALVQMRTDLYKTIKASKLETEQQQQSKLAIDLMERELNRLKQQLNDAKEAKYRKLRLIEINTYYGKRYQSYAHLFKTIAFFALIAAPFAILSNKGWIPELVGIFVIGMILVLGSIQVGLQVIDLANRSTHNWDEYDWYFNKHKAPIQDLNLTEKDLVNPWTNNRIQGKLTCIGQQCCDQQSSYDPKLNKCVSFA